jgi:hypothetical protein
MFSLNIYEWQQDVARYVVLRIPPLVHLCQICIYLKGYQTTRPADNSDRDKSARKRGLVGPYVKTTRTINKIDRNHKDTVWHLSTVLGNVKKKSLYNQPKPYFFQKIIVKSFLDRFLQMLHQNFRNCLYFDWLFTHYVVMSDFYLYIIFVFPVCV